MLAVGVVVLLLAGAVALTYGRQIVSYLTHRKGGPSTSSPYVVLDPPPALHIVAVGDTGDAGRRLDANASSLARIDDVAPFDVLLLLGDIVYPSGDPDRLDELVFEPFAPLTDHGAEVLAILGNHDVMQDRGDEMMERLGMPGRWWARTIDDVLIVGIDSNEVDDPEQFAFAEQALATTDATWKILAIHHPPYSAGYQSSSLEVRELYSPLAARYGVQLVLSGHDHDYQRSVPIDGVTYVVSGGGSGLRGTGEDDFTAVSWSMVHFADISVYPDRMVVRAVGTDGQVADEFILSPGTT